MIKGKNNDFDVRSVEKHIPRLVSDCMDTTHENKAEVRKCSPRPKNSFQIPQVDVSMIWVAI